MLVRANTATRGFTMIEVMIAITILAILMALGGPRMRIMLENAKIRSAAEGLRTGLQFARAEAVRRNAPIALNVEFTGDTGWTIGCMPVDPATCADAMIQERQRGEDRSTQINIAPAGTVVTFDNMGSMTNPAAGNGCGAVPAATASSACFMVTTQDAAIAADSRPLAVVIEVGGKVRLCDPSVNAGDTRSCAN